MNKFLVSALSLAAAISLNANVIATAGDISVTEDEIAPFLQQPNDGMHAMMGGEGNVSDEAKKTMIDNYIKYKLLVKEAKDSGVEKDPDYAKQLKIAQEGIAFGIWQKKQFDATMVNDDEVKKYYDENIDAFKQPEQVRAKHILVKDEKAAKDIIAKLSKVSKEKIEAEFSKIAGEKSIDPTAKENGGELGFFSKNQMVEPFANAVFAMKDGEISKKPTKTDFGYHIIYKEETKKAANIPLESLKEMIKQNLKSQKFQKAIDNKAEELFGKIKVEYK